MTPTPIPEASIVALLLATVPPLLAFGIILVGTRSRPRLSAGISLAAVSVCLICALYLLIRHRHLDAPMSTTVQWLASGSLVVPVGFLLDPASLVMLAVVAVICCLVQIYSLGYMAGDPGFARYYAYMSLFAWAMTSLTLSPTLLQLYVFWELVGLASYLLIGFWYEKFSASEAGKKAFVMTRFGDVALFLGILVVLLHLGSVDILALHRPEVLDRLSMGKLTLATLLIFGGIVGKSAQFPLLTWLPDAMEGPTPVSALLHSATMVAAGVFLFARLHPFFSLSPTTMAVCLAVGTVSMLLAATMAMVARDIKQVWAYSTISQLGLMIMGLAAGGYTAGFFHLTTHAFFKALLFLSAGVFIHAYGTNDMFEIGKQGGRRLKTATLCTVVGAAALAGIPPLSGYFSKESVMGALADLHNPAWLAAGLLGAFLTAYYAFRLIFAVLFPAGGLKPAASHEATGHDGHGGWPMTPPLLVLAGATLVLGVGQRAFEAFLSGGPPAAAHHPWLPYVAVGLAAAGAVLAWVEFGRPGSARVGFVERVPALGNFFAERWYLDRFWRMVLDQVVYRFFSGLCTANDQHVIDAGIDGLGAGTVTSGRFFARVQGAMVQFRLLALFVVMICLALYFFL